MSKLFLHNLGAVGLLAAACLASSAASAQVSASYTPGAVGVLQPNEMLFDDFEGYGTASADPHFTYSGDVRITNGLTPGESAPPFGDTSDYLAVVNGSATFDFGHAVRSFSFDLSSADNYNWLTVTLYTESGPTVTLNGDDLNGLFAANGDQTNPDQNGRVKIYGMGGETFTKASFASTSPAFELDNIATSPAPEPTSWAMMLGGFSLLGATMRRRRTSITFA